MATTVPPVFQAQALVNAATPTQKVQQYRNQQLGGLVSGTQSTLTPPAVAQPPNTQASPADQISQTAQDALQNAQNEHEKNEQMVAQLTQQRQQQEAAEQLSQGSQQGSANWSTGPAENQFAKLPMNAPGGGYNGRLSWTPEKGLSNARNKALETAFSYVGDPYVLGGTSHQGIDCSGLVMAVYDQFGWGKYLDSHWVPSQSRAIPGYRTSVNNLEPGDIVVWNDGSHIAIYAGNGMIVAAAAPGEGVKYQPVWGNVTGIHITLPGE